MTRNEIQHILELVLLGQWHMRQRVVGVVRIIHEAAFAHVPAKNHITPDHSGLHGLKHYDILVHKKEKRST